MAGRVVNRANVLAGGFILASLALAVWMSFKISSGSGYAQTVSFVARFSLADGAMGVKAGSPVMLGGLQIGTVREVRFSTENGVANGVDVNIEARADLALFDDAEVYLEKPLLGSLSTINITSTGRGAGAAIGSGPRIGEGDVLPGRLAPPGFLAQAGVGAEQVSQIQQLIKDAQVGVNKFSSLVDRLAPKIESGVEELSGLTREVRGSWNGWSPRIDSTLLNIEKSAARVEPILAKIDAGADDARALLADAKDLVAANRAKVDEIIETVRAASGQIGGETMPRVARALDDASAALGSFSRTLERAQDLVTSETPNARRILANLRLMSDQLKLTAIEVRSQPWRLLVQPTTKEIAEQVLYDATRAYASASSDLRAASEALEAAAAGGTQREGIDELSRSLADALHRYREAETALFEKLKNR